LKQAPPPGTAPKEVAGPDRLASQFDALIGRLRHACDEMKRHGESDEATLLAIALQLSAFTDFIDGFDHVRAAGLSAPMLKLKMALLDKSRGSPAPLLEFARPRHRPPTTHARDAVVAWAALALELSMKAGQKKGEAASAVATLLNRHRSRWPVDLTRSVTATTVKKWRDAVTGNAEPSLVLSYYHTHAEYAADSQKSPAERAAFWRRYLPTLLAALASKKNPDTPPS
jgi:hypothetical protein